MIRALFTAVAALALAIGTALWFDDGGGENDPVTATAESASAVDPAPAVKAEEGSAVARSGPMQEAPAGDAGAAEAAKAEARGPDATSEAVAAGRDPSPAPEPAPTLETVELGRPDFGSLPAEAAAEETGEVSPVAPAPVDPERSAALIRRMLALYEVVRE